MERVRPAPTARESEFGLDELFFSTTDLKGRIRSGNAVFTRVSRYPEDDLVGSPHNIIRHPDMPRVVFRLLWAFLQSGRPIAAYVKNMAADGAYYWVMASAVPIADGYLSIRLKPTGPHFAVVTALYAELLEVERAIEAEGGERARDRAMDASEAVLARRLAEAGFDRYEEFMHAAFTTEVTSRERALGRRTPSRSHPGEPHGLDALLARCTVVHDFLALLLTDIEGYAQLNRTLAEKSQFVLGLAEQIRLFSLNAQLASDRLGSRGTTLSAVAGIMRGQFTTVRPQIEGLGDDIRAAVELLGDLGFRIAVSKLQTEMAAVFITELQDGGRPSAERDLTILTQCLVASVEGLLVAREDLGAVLGRLANRATRLGKDLEAIRVLEVNGQVEAARASITGKVVELFDTISDQVSAARVELQAFGEVRADGDRDRATVARVRAELTGISDLVALSA